MAKDEYKTTSLRLPEKLVEFYDDLAAKTNRSRNELMELVLTEAIGNITIQDLSEEASEKAKK